jgi:hypothetical protein
MSPLGRFRSFLRKAGIQRWVPAFGLRGDARRVRLHRYLTVRPPDLFLDIPQLVLAEENLIPDEEGWAAEGAARD